MSTYIFPQTLRDGIALALPQDTSLHGETPQSRHLYLPATHAKALNPNSMLIQGMRGSGKSFWFQALQDRELRALIGGQAGLDAETQVTVGFGERPTGSFPRKDVLMSLLCDSIEPRHIWQTVVFFHVAGKQAPQAFCDADGWKSRVDWVRQHPEQVETLLFSLDQQLDQVGQYHLVLFDALDRTADDWPAMNALVRGLLQVALDIRAYRRIRLKIFARPDQLEDPLVSSFPDASKVVSQKVRLDWPRRELYGLLWQYLANSDNCGELFRVGVQRLLPAVTWAQNNSVWLVPERLRNSEDEQKQVFHAITGPWMGRDKRRGFPYSWLPSHLSDSRGEVSPRSFLAALRHAAEEQPRPEQQVALHYESIKRGVQEASKIRVIELEEDYPWIKRLFEPLAGVTVPCAFVDVQRIWDEQGVLQDLQARIASEVVRLPPAHLDAGADGVLKDLLELGLVEQLLDKRINLPDVYRVGYGMGRRGGVKPVRS